MKLREERARTLADGGAGVIRSGTTTNIHSLAVSLEALTRLLERRTGGGALLQADPALIEIAIQAGHETLRGVDEKLAEVLSDPASTDRSEALSMTKSVAELDNLLVTIEEALRRLKR